MPHLGPFATLSVFLFIFNMLSTLSVQRCPIITHSLWHLERGLYLIN
jgi:hypothetical protein